MPSATINRPPARVNAGDAARPTPQARRCRVALASLDDVAKELGALYRRAAAGAIPMADAGRLAFILVSLGRVLEAATFEARIVALENAADELRL